MDSGSREVVLSGIHLGQYGRDLVPAQTLEGLLQGLIEGGLPGRIRLSSIEPLEITDTLLDILNRADGLICRHIHIPFQSGSDRILKSMERPYTSHDFRDAVTRLRSSVPGIGIGCDIICGFPGETEDDFALTEMVISDLKIPFVHAFPYSPRPGTRACLLKDDVPRREKKARVQRLRTLAEGHRRAFALEFVGLFLRVALESGNGRGDRMWGLADNYLRVTVKYGEEMRPGDLEEVFIEGITEDTLEGRLKPRVGNG
jgi:threonylcarbamoyladenosine tRNA methylthiotransferase MtaB